MGNGGLLFGRRGEEEEEGGEMLFGKKLFLGGKSIILDNWNLATTKKRENYKGDVGI